MTPPPPTLLSTCSYLGGRKPQSCKARSLPVPPSPTYLCFCSTFSRRSCKALQNGPFGGRLTSSRGGKRSLTCSILSPRWAGPVRHDFSQISRLERIVDQYDASRHVPPAASPSRCSPSFFLAVRLALSEPGLLLGSEPFRGDCCTARGTGPDDRLHHSLPECFISTPHLQCQDAGRDICDDLLIRLDCLTKGRAKSVHIEFTVSIKKCSASLDRTVHYPGCISLRFNPYYTILSASSAHRDKSYQYGCNR